MNILLKMGGCVAFHCTGWIFPRLLVTRTAGRLWFLKLWNEYLSASLTFLSRLISCGVLSQMIWTGLWHLTSVTLWSQCQFILSAAICSGRKSISRPLQQRMHVRYLWTTLITNMVRGGVVLSWLYALYDLVDLSSRPYWMPKGSLSISSWSHNPHIPHRAWQTEDIHVYIHRKDLWQVMRLTIQCNKTAS